MSENIKNAIIEFIANEFKLDPQTVGDDLNFSIDLGLTPPAIQDLLQRLQDSLDFTLPEDKLNNITSIEDLVLLLDDQENHELS
jgi:acyl carrier protein